MEGSVIFLLLLGAAWTSANLDEALRSYETLHPAQFKHKIVKRDLDSKSPHIRQVEFDSLGRHFHLYLQKKKDLLSSNFKVVAIDGHNKKRKVNIEDSHPYEGYLIGEAGTSEVHAVWEDDDNMAASITTQGGAIFVEPSWRHLPKSENYTMIIYRKEDVKIDKDFGKSFCGYVDANKDLNLSPPPSHDDHADHHSDNDHRNWWTGNSHKHAHRPKRQAAEDGGLPRALPLTFTPVHTTCQVLLVADYLFYKNMGKSSLSKTSAYLIGLLDRVNAIYRKTDFGNGYKDMGFEIKEIRIHESYTTPRQPQTSYLPHYNQQLNYTWQTKNLLEAFSKDRSHSRFCLAHLFTYQAFTGGVLGLAYIGSPRTYSVGGICSPVASSLTHSADADSRPKSNLSIM